MVEISIECQGNWSVQIIDWSQVLEAGKTKQRSSTLSPPCTKPFMYKESRHISHFLGHCIWALWIVCQTGASHVMGDWQELLSSSQIMSAHPVRPLSQHQLPESYGVQQPICVLTLHFFWTLFCLKEIYPFSKDTLFL